MDAVSIQTGPGAEICDCSFKNCGGSVIEATSYGGPVNIGDCRFENISFREGKSSVRAHSDRAFLRFSMSNGGETSRVKNCVFNDVRPGKDFIIMADTFEKVTAPIVEVDGCSFINCVTDRDDGELVRHGSTYYDFWDKERSVKGVSVDYGSCEGLLESGDSDNYGTEGFFGAPDVGKALIGGTALVLGAIALGKYVWDRRG
jgi:hypothetical protein